MTTNFPPSEPAMIFGALALSPKKEMVRKFYKDMWDNADISLIPEMGSSTYRPCLQ